MKLAKVLSVWGFFSHLYRNVFKLTHCAILSHVSALSAYFGNDVKLSIYIWLFLYIMHMEGQKMDDISIFLNRNEKARCLLVIFHHTNYQFNFRSFHWKKIFLVQLCLYTPGHRCYYFIWSVTVLCPTEF